MPGIDLREGAQMEFLEQKLPVHAETAPFHPRHSPRRKGPGFFLGNGSFDHLDALVLYSFIREFAPRKIVEVGAGHSTRLMVQALRTNGEAGGASGRLVSIDPFTPKHLNEVTADHLESLESPVQDVDRAVFWELKKDDILFIDSSHVAKAGSDVNVLLLEIIPRLSPGTLIHFHDIFLPYEYGEDWFGRPYQFWSEQYLLQALMTLSRAFQIEWMSYFLHRRHPQEIETLIPGFYSRDQCPTSFWLRKME